MSRRVPVFGPKTETQRRATGQMAASPINAPQRTIVYVVNLRMSWIKTQSMLFISICIFKRSLTNGMSLAKWFINPPNV